MPLISMVLHELGMTLLMHIAVPKLLSDATMYFIRTSWRTVNIASFVAVL
jgi:hypothetical protein